MLEIIFSSDFYETDPAQVKVIAQAFELDRETAEIVQIMFSSFEHSGKSDANPHRLGIPEVEEYIHLLLYRIDSGICMLEQQSSDPSSPLQFYYRMTESIKQEESMKCNKKLKKDKKKKKPKKVPQKRQASPSPDSPH